MTPLSLCQVLLTAIQKKQDGQGNFNSFCNRKPHWLPDDATLIELVSLDNYSFPFMHQVKIHFHWGEA
jgi:hypothetical protein